LRKLTYAESGVDIDKEEKAIKELLSEIKSSRDGIGKPLGGHYAGLIEFGRYALVLCTDGVGSKVLIASSISKWDTVGIDCIAMNVNDAICVGAEPIAFVDYIAINDPKPEILREIGKGLERGAREANISIVGGETASLPELVNGFDLAGTCLAYVEKEHIVTGEKIQPGDKIIGIQSSGLHSNGFTLVRRIIREKKLSYTDYFPDGIYHDKTIGEILLTPTEIYVKPILALLKEVDVHGLSHITGGGLRNLKRLKKNVSYQISNPLPPQEIFRFIQREGKIDDKEMYQTFNMGMGFTVIVDKEDAEKTIEILEKNTSREVKIVGEVTHGEGVSVPSLGIHL